DAQFAHNEPLEWLTAFGLVGGVLALALLVRLWPREKGNGRSTALTALGTASFFDFCLHTPSIVLQAAGLLAPVSRGRAPFSWAGGLLGLGLVLGLFGSAAWTPSLVARSQALEAGHRLPEALEGLSTAARLDAWDARVEAAQAGFLERLYLATGDPVWESRSDEAWAGVLRLEAADGAWAQREARRWTARFEEFPGPASAAAARDAWGRAEQARPLDAFVYFGEGLFLEEAARKLEKPVPGLGPARAEADFKKAAELEPNYAAAWVNLGHCQRSDPAGRAEARDSFRTALAVHDRWKDAPGLAPLERDMVSLPPPVVAALRRDLK
ncbi:MAG TPA: hypothetical protein VFR02_01825, partial [bacterium]|nr:hypothetical protein [bacterium]